MSIWNIILTGIVLVIHVLPLLTMLTSTWKIKEKKEHKHLRLSNTVFFVLGLIVNLIVFIAVHWYLWGYKNFLMTIMNLYTSQIYANDIKYFAYSSMMCLIVSLLLSFAVRCRRHDLSDVGKSITAILISIYGVLVCIVMSYSLSMPSQVVLNEICSNNQSIYLDDSYTTGDYIELYNPCAFPCRLNSLYLSDDPNNLRKVSLKDYDIGAKDFQVIKLSKEANSFSVDKKGETIYLSDQWGSIHVRLL